MSVAEYNFEPGLKEATPRRVRVRAGLSVLLAAALVLLAVIFVFGFASLFEAGRLVWLARAGTTVDATVTALYYGDRAQARFDPDRVRQISGFEYRFTTSKGRVAFGRMPLELSRTMLNERPLLATMPADGPAPPPVPVLKYVPGRHLRVRYATFGGSVFSRPWERAAVGHTAFLLISGLVVLTIAAYIAMHIFSRIRAGYNLVRHGLVTVGVIRAKDAVSADTTRYYVTFAELQPDEASVASAPIREWRRPCSAQQFLTFAPDQFVTLISPPNNPDETTLFRLLPFGR